MRPSVVAACQRATAHEELTCHYGMYLSKIGLTLRRTDDILWLHWTLSHM